MKGWRPRRPLLALVSGVALGCSPAAQPATAPQPATPPTVATAPKVDTPPKVATTRAAAEPTSLGSIANPRRARTTSGLPPGVVMASADTTEPTTVDPAPLDLASLPSANLPAPLRHDTPPAALPPGTISTALRIEPVETGARWRETLLNAVYIVLDAKLGRLQIGALARAHNTSDRVYRTCGDKYYPRPTLTPARWETLSFQDGAAEYRVVDAWFDAKSCEAVVVRETVVHPAPVLGGLLFAYQSHCDDCVPQDTVTFLTPPLTQPTAAGLGGSAVISNGNFTLIELPLVRGGAATFTGAVRAHAMREWLDASRWTALNADAVLGIEITQAVPDRAPHAIAFANLRQR